jgi:hypothetical protein
LAAAPQASLRASPHYLLWPAEQPDKQKAGNRFPCPVNHPGSIPLGKFEWATQSSLPVTDRSISFEHSPLRLCEAGRSAGRKFIVNRIPEPDEHSLCYFLANYSDRAMALCGDATIVPMGSCLRLGMTYP